MQFVLFLAMLALGSTVAAAPARAEAPFAFEATPGDLPKDVRPLAYRIDLVPDLDRLATADGSVDVDFAGTEEVDVELLRATDSLMLNALNLAITRVALDGIEGRVAFDESRQTATFLFPHPVAPGRHTLAVAFAGKISSQSRGFYYVVYETPAGRARMLTTQFQATDARRMFPGWDEPAFKATFTLSVVLPAGFRAISNMPIAREEPAGPGRRHVTFGTSPKMSTYLLVLSAGDLERISRTIAGIEVGINVPAGRTAQARYALDTVIAQVLPYYTEYFAVPYPLPKLDHIAIPGNMFGSMENWGAITHIDSDLLFDPDKSPESTRQNVFGIVAHEIAHQWAGNLVTMAWWDNLWLNEGFAQWMQKKVADRFNPSWKVWVRAHASKEAAMAADALRTVQPVQHEILDASQAMSTFDSITYDKSGAFIRMLEAYLGEDRFRAGMRAYMAAHAYGSTTSADLWATLSAASGQPVAEIAASFIEQPGIPLIRVATSCIDGSTVATLRQERFSIHNPYAEPRIWKVPVTIGRVGDAAARPILIGETPQTMTFAGCGIPLKANWGDVGYYRVQYEEPGLQALGAAYSRLPAADRVNLVADSWALVQADRADAKSFLDLTRQLAGETEHAVWEQVIGDLRAIDRLERGTPGREAFRAYARGIIRPVLDRLGWDIAPDEGAESRLLRALTIMTLGRLGDPAVIAEARRRFAAFLRSPQTLDPDLRDPVVATVGRWADRRTFEDLHRLGREAASTEEKMRFYGALATASDPALIDDAVRIALTDQALPNGQVEQFFYKATGANDDPDYLWRRVFAERRGLFARMSESDRQYLLPDVAGATSSPAIALEMRWAPESRASRGARSEADKAGERIEFQADFKERLLPAVDAWIKANGG